MRMIKPSFTVVPGGAAVAVENMLKHAASTMAGITF